MIRRLFVSLTFDDGFLSHVIIARELVKHGIYSTFFIAPYFKGRDFLSNKLNSLNVISKLGHEIGSHGLTHRFLTALSPGDIEYEVRMSKAIIEDIIGRKVYGFAYPFDDFNNQVVAIVMRHYDYARRGFNSSDLFNMNVLLNGYLISRYLINSINPLLSMRRFIRILKLRISYNNHRRDFNGDIGWLVFTFHNEPIEEILHLVSIIKRLGGLLGIRVEFKPMCNVFFGECLE